MITTDEYPFPSQQSVKVRVSIPIITYAVVEVDAPVDNDTGAVLRQEALELALEAYHAGGYAIEEYGADIQESVIRSVL